MNQTKIAIVGASGYSGQELIRLLLQHPAAELTCFTSRQYVGRDVAEVFPRFRGQVAARFVEPTADAVAGSGATVAFLALPHGVAAGFAPGLLARGIRVLDLSADFRLRSPAVYQEYYEHAHPAPDLLAQAVYGLPEVYRDQIRGARLIACPGCYPTSILLGAMPALQRGLARPTGITVASLSGVSGAGRKVADEYLFTECNESVRAYGLPKHRHLSEIEQELSGFAGAPVVISFAPHLVPVNRGINSTIWLEAPQGADALAVYRDAYRAEPFVRVTEPLPETKNVVGTNYCDLAVRFDARTGRLVVVTAIDNLTKGAAGQAVQCLNLMCGYPETTGLR
jgi:N-acetyl-gamma-glutamyl-phosphate reductase